MTWGERSEVGIFLPFTGGMEHSNFGRTSGAESEKHVGTIRSFKIYTVASIGSKSKVCACVYEAGEFWLRGNCVSEWVSVGVWSTESLCVQYEYVRKYVTKEKKREREEEDSIGCAYIRVHLFWQLKTTDGKDAKTILLEQKLQLSALQSFSSGLVAQTMLRKDSWRWTGYLSYLKSYTDFSRN